MAGRGGCFGGKKTEAEKDADQKSKIIDSDLKKLKKKQTFRLLLLGTGDAGKSTFAKQMCLVHQNGFTKEKKQATVSVLHSNCLDSMKELLKAAEEWSVKIEQKLTEHAELVSNTSELTPECAQAITALWAADSIKTVFTKGAQLQLPGGNSNVEYFFTNAQRFARADFEPSDADMLRAKSRTTGVAEISFNYEGAEFVMVDVGGQRSERRKWLQCFSDISAVIYLVAVNEYDMKMEEDNATNRMEESVKLFHKLTGSQWLNTLPFILFLNKSDLFVEKVKTSPLSKFFEDYDTFVVDQKLDKKSDFDKGITYIQTQYENTFAGNKLYTFTTNALDTESCKKVFLAVRDNIVSKAINESM